MSKSSDKLLESLSFLRLLVMDLSEDEVTEVEEKMKTKLGTAFTKPPLFQRNRLTCSGNPLFESCVEGKAKQREITVYSRSSFQRPQH